MIKEAWQILTKIKWLEIYGSRIFFVLIRHWKHTNCVMQHKKNNFTKLLFWLRTSKNTVWTEASPNVYLSHRWNWNKYFELHQLKFSMRNTMCIDDEKWINHKLFAQTWSHSQFHLVSGCLIFAAKKWLFM